MLIYDNVVWAVKGCYHPEGYAVALPRLVNGRKIKKMKEGMEIVRTRYPNLLKYIPEIGLEVPLIPLELSVILDPYKKVINNEKILEFLRFFNNVGITGSYLYSNEVGNDIDLISEDEKNYEILVELRKKGITRPINYVLEDEIEVMNSEDFLRLKKRRVLEGIFKGIPYTFKIVKCVKMGKVIGNKYFEGMIRIIDPIKPYSLPIIYYTDNNFYLTSFRTRFTELNEGCILRVKGNILIREDIIEFPLDHAEYVEIIKI